jgi:hypothetical protein
MAYKFEGQILSPAQLPDVTHGHIDEAAPLPFGVAELESMLKKGDSEIRLSLPGGSALLAYMNAEAQEAMPGQRITALYWATSSVAVTGVLDRIRTNLVAIVAEMRATGTKGSSTPPAEAADQAVNVVIYGKQRGPININTANTSGDGSSLTINPTPQPDTSLWSRLRKPGAFIVGLAAVIGAVVAVAAWQGWNPF